MIQRITAVGDCNTLGAGENENNSYPEMVAELLGISVANVGYTMSTTREGIALLADNVEGCDCVFIQFGLVDSYKTFKFSPYVLYYPDNPARKLLRSITKKIKKTCRNAGLNKLLGEKNVVPPAEYEANIRHMLDLCPKKTVFLIDTVPNKELWRNDEIRRYNSILDIIAAEYSNCMRVRLFETFEKKLDRYYLDATHCNSKGYEVIAEKIIEQLKLVKA